MPSYEEESYMLTILPPELVEDIEKLMSAILPLEEDEYNCSEAKGWDML